MFSSTSFTFRLFVKPSLVKGIFYRVINVRSPDQFKNQVVQIQYLTWLNISKSAKCTMMLRVARSTKPF